MSDDIASLLGGTLREIVRRGKYTYTCYTPQHVFQATTRFALYCTCYAPLHVLCAIARVLHSTARATWLLDFGRNFIIS